ncbi:hypothetical protein ACJX0J_007853, partial [Zea mays]
MAVVLVFAHYRQNQFCLALHSTSESLCTLHVHITFPDDPKSVLSSDILNNFQADIELANGISF